jgi:TRAP-type C4-dicarboxylate transport system permease small subunit
MRTALLVIFVGVLTYLGLAVYATVAGVSIGYVEAAVVVGCTMLITYGVARIVSAYRAGRQGL